MTLETRSLERTFRYNSVDLSDPGAQYSAEEVRDLYTATYPELANAAIEGPEQKEGKLVYTFRRPVGTKGNEMQVIYTGWPSLKLAPDLAICIDHQNRQFGWLFAKHPDGQWVTLADLKPFFVSQQPKP